MSLPLYPTRFVGRERDLARIGGTRDRGARIVTVHGPGGIGKTRLAVEYARAWRREQRRPAAFCPLAQARSLTGVCEAVAGALGVQLGHAGADDANVQRIGRWMAARDAGLIVMDNLERVARTAGPAMHRWAAEAPDVTFLGTSREVLGVDGEHVVAVDTLPSADGLRLFVDRMPGDAEVDEHVVAGILERLEGIPLAIELAAARLEVLSLPELAAHLQERFRALRDPSLGSGRHATLWTTLLWSWDGLAPFERNALAQLSVFVGHVPVDAATDVLTLPDDAPTVPDVLHSLARKSLLRASEPGRYLLYDTVRDFAAHQLPANEPVEDRHAHWFAEHALSWSRGIHGHDGATRRRRLRDERDNLVAAVERSVSAGRYHDAARALRALHPILLGTASHAWYVRHLDAVVEHAGAEAGWLSFLRGMTARHSRDIDAAQRWFARALDGEPDLELQATALLAQGEIARQRSDPAAESVLYARALDVARRGGLVHVEAEAVRWQSMQDVWMGRVEDGERHAGRAVELARSCGDAFQEGYALCVLGMLRGDAARREEEIAVTRQAVVAFEAIGDTRTQSWALGNLGTALLATDALDEARESLSRAIALRERFLESASAYMVQIFHVYMGLCDVFQDRADAALGHLRPAEERLGDDAHKTNAWYHGNALAALAAAHLGAGDVDEAIGRAGRAEERLAGLQTHSARVPRVLAQFVRHFATVRRAVSDGDRTGARSALVRAETARRELAPSPALWASVLRFVDTGLSRCRGEVDGWWIASDGAWFEPPDGKRVPLGQPRLARVLRALAEAGGHQPDEAVSVDALVAAVYPDEQLVRASARARVYTAVSELRKAGLTGIESRSGGYTLHCTVVR